MKRAVFEELSGLNRLIHDPSRLAILTALSPVARPISFSCSHSRD